MRRTTVLAGLAIATAGGSLVAASTGSAESTTREYVVLYEQGASADAAAQAVKAAGGTIVKVNRAVGVATVRSADDSFARDASKSKSIEAAVANRSIGRAEASRKAKEDAIETDGATGATGPLPAPAVGGDPLSGVQWDMKAIGATPGGSYATQPGSHAVRVGILDTGVDGSHPDIAPNFNAQLSRNFTTDDPVIDGPCAEDPDQSCKDPANVDEDGHGTHVASTIGSPLNGLGMAGVAPGVELVNIRAGQDSGYFFLQPTVDALTYAGDTGIDVVNMSYYIDPWLFNCANNPADSVDERLQQRTIVEATQRALDYAHDRGVTLVSAEGNGNTDLGKPTVDDSSPDYPDADLSPHHRDIDNTCLNMPTEGDGVIGVTSTGQSGRKAFYSDYGLEQADVAAPGGDSREYYGSPAYAAQENKILAAFPESLGRTTDTNVPPDGKIDIDANGNVTSPQFVKSCSGDRCAYYQYIQGTSMASPHAAGVAALIVAARGTPDPVHGGLTLAPATVEKVLAETATDTPCPANEPFTYPFDADGAYTATCEGTLQKNGFFGEGLVNALAAGTTPATDPGTGTGGGGGGGTGGGGTGGGGGGGGAGGPAVGLPRLDVRFAVGRTTVVKRLMLTAAKGSTVMVTCKGGGCPKGFVTYVVGASGRRDLAVRFAGRKLQPGARITIDVATRGIKVRRFVLRVRSGRVPLSTRAVR